MPEWSLSAEKISAHTSAPWWKLTSFCSVFCFSISFISLQTKECKGAIGNSQVPKEDLGLSIFVFHLIFLRFLIFSNAAKKKIIEKSTFSWHFPCKYQNVAINLDNFLQFLARFLKSVWVKLHEIFEIAFGLLIKCDNFKIFQICQGSNFPKNMDQFFHENDFFESW